jgi:hypothetical protein
MIINNYAVECSVELEEELKENSKNNIIVNWFNFKVNDIYYDNNGDEYHIQEINHKSDKTGYVKLCKKNILTANEFVEQMERDKRNLIGKICIFDTQGLDSKWKKYDKQKCTVINRFVESEYDFEEVGTIWKIIFEDGIECDAFADELTEV